MQRNFQNEGSLLRDAEGSLFQDAEGSLLRDAEGSLLRGAEALYSLGAIGNPYCLVWLHLYAITSSAGPAAD